MGCVSNSYLKGYADGLQRRNANAEPLRDSLGAVEAPFTSITPTSMEMTNLILKDTNGNCWKFTTSTGGVLSAGASVACP
jgi:hypothetical protein